MKKRLTQAVLFSSICLVIMAGCIILRYPGIQMDEAIFAGPYYQPAAREFRIRLFHHDIPLMVMTYIGTLKTLLWWPLVAIFRAGFPAHPRSAAWVFRLPTVLAGALTVWIFFYLTKRVASRWTALIAVTLLASDPTFLLTNTIDWGPVALEHLLLVTACFFLVKYAQDRVPRDLPLGFFFLGLALWNKAVFVWALAGLFCAVMTVFRQEVFNFVTRRQMLLATAGFVVGALPFLIYNGHRRGETFRSTAHLDPRGAPAKFIHLRSALGGYGLYGYFVSEEWSDNPKVPTDLPGRVAVYLRDHLGEHRNGGMDYAVALAILAIPLWWRSRAARFCLIYCTVTWVSMASTRDAGASIHHTVLLWPFPQLFVAIALATIPWKPVGATLCLLLVTMNLLVVNQHISQYARNGADTVYSDAMYNLATAVTPVPGQTVYILDWGIQFPLDVLENGLLHMRNGHEPFLPPAQSDWAKGAAARMFADPGGLFIAHTAKRENFAGVRQRFDEASLAAGCHPANLRTIPDSNGRPVFEVFTLSCSP